MDYTLLNKLPVWCKNYDIHYAVICSGSRSAPLTLSFAGYSEIRCIAATDERSAGFIALGIAKATKKAVVVITTSGTAVVNLFPAIAEAYYQNIPLLALTADREPKAALRFDGQAINQEQIFGTHVGGYFQMPLNIEDGKLFSENVKQALELLNNQKPIHLNFPFKEPFYPADYPFIYDGSQTNIQLPQKKFCDISDELKTIWSGAHKKLIVCGFGADRHYGTKHIAEFAKAHQIPVVADITSNIYSELYHTDLLIRNIPDSESFVPDLLLTIGGNHTSKVLKNYIKSVNISHHWNINDQDIKADYFGIPTARILANKFFNISDFEIDLVQKNYYNIWQEHNEKGKKILNDFIEKTPFCELNLVNTLMHRIPAGSVLHLANSMAVRWANIIGNPGHLEIFCNRGTSGIDGCTSTAIGAAIAQPGKKHFLLTGDMAFQYDSNAFFNNSIPDNLTIVVLNNHGGNIFKLIEGPTEAMPIENYFTNKHGMTFEYLAKHFDLQYMQVDNLFDFETYLQRKSEKINLIEVLISNENYNTIFENYKHLRF